MIEVPTQFDSLEVGMLIHDPETGSVLYANDSAEELYGYSKSELMEMDVTDFSSSSFTQEEAIQRIRSAAEGNSQKFEWRNKRSTGELYWVEVRLSDISIEDDEYVVALVRNITEYKMHLRHLRVLTRITRHNLRNKLNVIDGFLEELDVENKNENISMYKRIKNSISDLLDLTNWIDTVKSSVRMEKPASTQNISNMVLNLGKQYQEEYEEITWRFECEEVYASADPKIRTAIKELLENAITHNQHEGLEITISVEKSQNDEQVLIRIIDTGLPIPDIEIEPIVGGYEPDPLEHGESIGLWEVQTIIAANGGRISIPENSPKRKVVEIALPRATKE